MFGSERAEKPKDFFSMFNKTPIFVTEFPTTSPEELVSLCHFLGGFARREILHTTQDNRASCLYMCMLIYSYISMSRYISLYRNLL